PDLAVGCGLRHPGPAGRHPAELQRVEPGAGRVRGEAGPRGPREELVRAPVPAVADGWPTDPNEPVYDLVPLVPRLGLTVDGTRVANEVGEDPWRFAGDVEYRIEKADVREPQPAGYHVAGWLLGNVAGVDGTAAEYAEQF